MYILDFCSKDVFIREWKYLVKPLPVKKKSWRPPSPCEWPKPWLFAVVWGDENTQLYTDYFIDPVINQPGFHGCHHLHVWPRSVVLSVPWPLLVRGCWLQRKHLWPRWHVRSSGSWGTWAMAPVGGRKACVDVVAPGWQDQHLQQLDVCNDWSCFSAWFQTHVFCWKRKNMENSSHPVFWG